MEQFLKRYLWITGIGALIVVLMPWLVIIGLMMLIVPGIILMALPTAFFWGAIFAFTYSHFKKSKNTSAALTAAGFVTAIILTAVPLPSMLIASLNIASHAQPDIIPTEKISPFGDIRVDLLRPQWDQNKSARLERNIRPFACDSLCVALLFAPNVTSVTVNKSERTLRHGDPNPLAPLNRATRTYRLLPMSMCSSRLPAEPRLIFGAKLWGKRRHQWQGLKAAWEDKLATEVCIVSDPPIAEFDVLLKETMIKDPPKTRIGKWSLMPSPTRIHHLEIRRGDGSLAFRRRRVSASALSLPLMPWINGSLGPVSPKFGWARTKFNDGKEAANRFDILEVVRLFTTLPETLPLVMEQD